MSSSVILATWSFGAKACAAGWPVLAAGGAALDAVEQACIAVEDDPAVDSVGYGGLPDFSGRVSLDGCVMLSPSQCGSVCFIRRFNHPVSLARRVMEKTAHVMMAGAGAEEFARSQGFGEEELLSPAAAARYQEMKSALERDPASAMARVIPANREEMAMQRRGAAAGVGADEPSHDTVGVLALDDKGTLAGACSTSGLAMKLPGRVGDSPIIGHGLYVHPKHGAAVATGNGELVIGTCGSFLAVESMRRGAAPEEALRECMNRLIESYDLKPHHQVGMIALEPDGRWAHVSLRSGYRTAVRSGTREEMVESAGVL
jgi:isoaspartyl peptidase/L-asparaginase-like protein (Ntn-hydrolase superfamily)